MIHIYKGDGEGKTVASVGLCARAIGHGWRVLFVQFLKNDASGEIESLKRLGARTLHGSVVTGFYSEMTSEQKSIISNDYKKILDIVLRDDAQLIVLDEVLHAIYFQMIDRNQMELVLKKKSEIVLTGRNAPAWIEETADYISITTKIKHPYDKGVKAREGIEY